MTDKHTPGPWHVNGIDAILSVAGNRSVAKVYHPEADARLIAAAPAMYDLLVELDDTPLDPDIVRILQPWFTKVESVVDAIEGDA